MENLITDVSTKVTPTTLAGTIPQVGIMFGAIIISSITFMFFRRMLRGARKNKAKIG